MEEQTYFYNEISKSLYKISRINIVEIVLTSNGLSDLIKRVGLQKYGIISIVDELRGIQNELSLVAGDFNELSEYLVDLDEEIDRLADERVNLESTRAWYQQMAVMEASNQVSLGKQVRGITAEQQALINAKMAATTMNTSVGEYEELRQSLSNPPFSPAFAVVSIGYPHRVGMSQYGAYGRSIDGQNYKQILTAYYNISSTSIIKWGNTSIHVYGCSWGASPHSGGPSKNCCENPSSCGLNYSPGTFFDVVLPLDTYILGLGEMPTSWGGSGGIEALKAQAVAGRSYALAWTNNGSGSICPSTYCQVYLGYNKGGYWEQAVNATSLVVMTSGGSPIKAYYASTAGGYTRLPTDFDVGWYNNPTYIKRVKDFGSEGAYDGPNYGNSPWYYKAWYASSDIHPWLTEVEMTDLLNAALLSGENSDVYNKYLSRPDLGDGHLRK